MTAERLKQALERLLSDVRYDRIVLFGSRARGDAGATSDYDILVILKAACTPQDRISLATRLRKSLASEGIDADVLVKSRAEAEYYRDKIGSVVRDALEEGIEIC